MAIVVACGGVSAPSPAYSADAARVQKIAAELDIPRRAWTICTVNQIGSAVQTGQAGDAAAIADLALIHCASEEQTLRTKAVALLGAKAADRLMERLVTEARGALVGSARTLEAAKAGGSRIDPAWPRVLGPVQR